VQDARRHGVEIRSPDLNASADVAILEPPPEPRPGEVTDGPDNGKGRPPSRWGVGGPAVRLGIGTVRGIGDDLAKAIAAGRPYVDMEDLVQRTGVTEAQLEALATAGAFGCFGLERREALWASGAVAQSRPGRLAGVVTGADAPALPGMAPSEEAVADLWATGVSPDGHPTRFVREHLDRLGVCTAAGLAAAPEGKVTVAGVVTHRQRPATAGGTLFVNLEDETGLINVVVSKGCWARHRRVARAAPAMLVKGRLERAEGVINVIAERMEALPLGATTRSRDFR
jgi:error-prone DNA polymerase